MMEDRRKAQQSEQQGTSAWPTIHVRDPSPARHAEQTLSLLRWQNLPAYHAQLVLFERDPGAVLSQAKAGREREALREVYQSEVKQERQRLAWEREAPQREKQAWHAAQQQRLEEQLQEHRQAKQAATMQRRQNERQANEAKRPQVKAERAKQRASQQPTRSPAKLAQQLLPFLEGTTRRELERAQKFLNHFTPQTRTEVLKLIVQRHPLEVEHLLYGLSGDQMETLLRLITRAKQDLGLLPTVETPKAATKATQATLSFAVFRPNQAKVPDQPGPEAVSAAVAQLVQLSQLGGASGGAMQSEVRGFSPAMRTAVARELKRQFPPIYHKLAALLDTPLAKPAAPVQPVMLPPAPVDPMLDEAVDVLLKLRTSLNNSGGHQVDVGKNSFGIQPSFDAEMAYRSVMSRVDSHELALLYHEQSGYSFERDFGPLRASYQKVQGITGEKTVPISPETLTRDALYNLIATKFAYDDELDEVAQALLKRFGYRSNRAVYGRLGTQLRPFTPLHPHLPPLLTFRGTEGSKLKTLEGQTDLLVTDSDPQGIAATAFAKNKALIGLWLDTLHVQGKVTVLGHSLGGALAQWSEGTWPEKIGNAVTFNAPGVPKSVVQNVKRYNAGVKPYNQLHTTHYRMTGDLISQGGAAFAPGEIRRFRLDTKGAPNLGGPFGGVLLDAAVNQSTQRLWQALTGEKLSGRVDLGTLLKALSFQTHLAPMLPQQLAKVPPQARTPDMQALLDFYQKSVLKGEAERPARYVASGTTEAENADPRRERTEAIRVRAGQLIEQLKREVASGQLQAPHPSPSFMSPGAGPLLEARDQARYALGSIALSADHYDALYAPVEQLVRAAKSKAEVAEIREGLNTIGHAVSQSAVPEKVKFLYSAWRQGDIRLRLAVVNQLENMWYAWHPEATT